MFFLIFNNALSFNVYIFFGKNSHINFTLGTVCMLQFFSLFLIYFLIEGKLLYNVAMVSAIKQCEPVNFIYVYVYIYICVCVCVYIYIYEIYIASFLSFPPLLHNSPLQVITEHQAGLPVLYSSFPLASYFSHNSVYLSMLLSQFVLPSSSPTVSTTPFSRSASSPLHPCKQVHQCYFSGFQIYASIYDICKTLLFFKLNLVKFQPHSKVLSHFLMISWF